MKYGRLLKGLSLLNIASLALLLRPQTLAQYLGSIEKILFSYMLNPIHPTNLYDIIQYTDNEYFVPVHYIKSGSSPFFDLFALAALCKEKHPESIFEIGTFEGLTAAVFARNSTQNSRVFTLDLPLRENDIERTGRSYSAHSIKSPYLSGYLINELGLGSQITRLIGDSALYDFSQYENKIDLFFIDGAHTEDYVTSDTLNAFRCINECGWVVWHDCFVPQVFSVIRRISKYLDMYHIRDTNLVVVFQKPKNSFPWRILETKIQ